MAEKGVRSGDNERGVDIFADIRISGRRRSVETHFEGGLAGEISG